MSLEYFTLDFSNELKFPCHSLLKNKLESHQLTAFKLIQTSLNIQMHQLPLSLRRNPG